MPLSSCAFMYVICAVTAVAVRARMKTRAKRTVQFDRESMR